MEEEGLQNIFCCSRSKATGIVNRPCNSISLAGLWNLGELQLTVLPEQQWLDGLVILGSFAVSSMALWFKKGANMLIMRFFPIH